MEMTPIYKRYCDLQVAMAIEQKQLREKYDRLFEALQEECLHESRYIDHLFDYHSGEYEDKWRCSECRKVW